MIFIGYAMIGAAAIWFLYKLYVSYTSAGGTDFALPVFDAALYPPILVAVGLYLVLPAYEVNWSVWIYIAIWVGSTVLAVAAIKLAEFLGDKPL
jgi:hypothetical protein